MKILIVDDHAANLKPLRARLEAEGHAVLEAANGIDALKILENERVDGVVSDTLMPRMDGYRLCLAVRKSARYGHLPFVHYASTTNAAGDRELSKSAGGDAYIERPAPAKTIVNALRAAAARPHRPAARTVVQKIEAPVLEQYSQSLVRKLEEKAGELERAHDELAQTEARLSGVIESALDAIVATDSMQRIILFNAAAEKMFGCPAKEAIGTPLNRFIPARFRVAHLRHLESLGRAGAGEPRWAAQMVAGLRQDGTEFPIEASISALKTPVGSIFTAFIRDVTERRRAEQALARSEAGLRQAQQIARLAHVITGPDGAFESWSETFPDLIGVPPSGLPGTTREWLEFIHPEDRASFRECAIESGRHGTRSDLEYRIRRKDEWVHVRQVMTPLADGDSSAQRAMRWFNTLQDISDQKKAELLIRSQNRVLSVLSGINALIVRSNEVGDLLQQACRIACEAGQYAIAWIGLIEEGANVVRFVAGHGAPDAYYESLRARLDTELLDSDSVIAQAVGRLEPVVLNDLETARYPMEHALAAGSRSLAVLPLAIEGKAIGAFTLHAGTPGLFDDEEIKLLRELAGDISYALDHFWKEEQITYLANYDGLTGLPNQKLFNEHLSEALYVQEGNGTMPAVAFVDVERFRRVNETLGRAAGDELLKEVAARLQKKNASAARIAGNVFAVRITGSRSVSEVSRILEEILAECFEEPFRIAGEELRIGCRAGVAVYPNDGMDAESLVHNAEAALRRAKAMSQKWIFYSPELNARAAEFLSLESKLRRAIERDEFVLHYQPKVSFPDLRISGLEALIRWQDPDRGLVPPGEFISMLEETGLIGTVGEWALRQALLDQGRWRASGIAPPPVAVNVSAVQLRNPNFGDLIADVVDANPGGTLELEITESMVMENFDRSIEMLTHIRAAGVTIAIDDFGTGYSSLSYIAKLPVTSLKIDRTFTNTMTTGPVALAIVSSIVALAHALDLKVVAEGVETEEQSVALQLMGCDEAQGFLFSRPISGIELEQMLRGGSLLMVSDGR